MTIHGGGGADPRYSDIETDYCVKMTSMGHGWIQNPVQFPEYTPTFVTKFNVIIYHDQYYTISDPWGVEMYLFRVPGLPILLPTPRVTLICA